MIEGDVWIVNHDDIRSFIEDYFFDTYSQIFDNLEEMITNNLIRKE